MFVVRPTGEAGEPGEVAAAARLGIIVSKRVGGAVARNRVKRLCRECFRQWAAMRQARADILVIAKPGSPSLNLAATRRQFQRLLRLLQDLPAAKP